MIEIAYGVACASWVAACMAVYLLTVALFGGELYRRRNNLEPAACLFFGFVLSLPAAFGLAWSIKRLCT